MQTVIKTDVGSWQDRCGVLKVVQTDRYGCGIACLAMVAGIPYEVARQQFNEYGLGIRRGCRPAYSTTTSELIGAVGRSGLLVQPRRWRGWSDFHGLGILKVRDDWRGKKGKWHWAVAFRHNEFGVVVFDPHETTPSFEQMPMDVICIDFRYYEPKGQWLQVEQRMPLDVA